MRAISRCPIWMVRFVLGNAHMKDLTMDATNRIIAFSQDHGLGKDHQTVQN